jgi:uncharacterized NAD(P)/FAD-binding protein YdhS
MPDQPTPTVVIVGAGFSGAVTAVQLLRHARGPLRVVLVNESGRMARGLAYGTRSEAHVLNVPAGNMSALAEVPEDFLRYCQWSDPIVRPESFVPRRQYGAYLEALLAAAEAAGDAQACVSRVLDRVVGRVVAIAPPAAPGGPAKVVLQPPGGTPAETLDAAAVVLAFGHFVPLNPAPALLDRLPAGRVVADPWRAGALATIGADDDVLLVGAGLTAVDVALSLKAAGHRGRLLAISRRGLAPQSHRKTGVVPGAVDGGGLALAMGSTVRQAVKVLRTAVAERCARGEDWRDVIGALRTHTPALWRGWSEADRARFLRHVRPHWEVLRHRCAPAAHDAFSALQAEGRLTLAAARLAAATAVDGGVQVTLRLRGGGSRTATVQTIVNCTGPSTDVRRSGSPLVAGLLDAGLLQADALGLGLLADASLHVLDAAGQPVPWLRYVGPLLKARDWEATAVPELRVHALSLARDMAATLAPLG